MKKYIVTGGAGFIGSHLVERLVREGNQVVIIDNLSTGHEEFVPKDPAVRFLNIDISNWSDLSKHFSYFEGSDGVFHFAACARIQPSINAPHLTHDTNVTGTLNILEIMRMCNVRSIVYSSSSSFYGLRPRLPCKESDPSDCQTPYSISKLMGSMYCKTWGKLHGIRNASLRYFNVYGRRSPLSGPYAPVVGLFFRQALTGKDMTIVGTGEQKRDFTHVADVVEANMLAMNKLNAPEDWIDVTGLTYNVGTGTNYTINEVGKKVRECLAKAGKTKVTTAYVPERIGESEATLADNTLAKQILEWQPYIDFDDGVEDLCSYFLNNIEKVEQNNFVF